MAIQFVSKKDDSIIVSLVHTSYRYKTVCLIYETGEKKGETFNITTSTLKRWWTKIEDNSTPLDDVDFNEVDKPYPEPEKQHFVDIPKSVQIYETITAAEKKTLDFYVPENYEELVTFLSERGIKVKRVNKEYVILDNDIKVKLRTYGIYLLVKPEHCDPFVERGLQFKVTKEPITPCGIQVKSQEDLESCLSVLAEFCPITND